MEPSGETEEASASELEPRWTERMPRPNALEALVLGTFALFGFAAGSRPIQDNSTFVHLRTGINMVHTWSIPRVDPYSFTAHGQPWVVQSWFASLLYGAAYVVGGVHLLQILNAVLFAALALVIALLARTGSGVRSMASAGAAVGLGIVYWTPRPLVFGLLGLALLIWITERNWSPLWVIPMMWVWVNTHGSFPFAFVWLGLRLLGEMFDTKSLRRPRWPLVVASVGGLVVAAINPLGPKLLVFPFTITHKQAAFKHVVEWATQNFQTRDGLFLLVALTITVLLLTRARLAWADALPVAGFLALGLFSARNIAPLAVVLAPALGRSMRSAKAGGAQPDLVRPQGERPAFARAAAFALAILVVAFGATSIAGPGFSFATYPTAAEQWMADRNLFDPQRHRVVAQDVVGCYLILLHGTHGRVFIDDRVDMYPLGVSLDYLALLRAQPTSPDILNRYEADVVLWPKGHPLVTLLQTQPEWKTVYADKGWVVLIRSG